MGPREIFASTPCCWVDSAHIAVSGIACFGQIASEYSVSVLDYVVLCCIMLCCCVALCCVCAVCECRIM